MMQPALDATQSTELRLLLACARWPQTEEDARLILELTGGELHAERFFALVQHHRLIPLVVRNLGTALAGVIPAEQQEVYDRLRQIASANSFRALRSLAELRRLTFALESEGIDVRVLKGIPLAQRLFGDLGLRSSGDLDLLISEADLPKADQVLRAAGYEGLFDIRRFSPRQFAFYRTHWKDIAYTNAALGGEVDLHWRCFRNREIGSGMCRSSAEEVLSIGNYDVKVLPKIENLLYLCVHGTLDGWLYLKSLADVGAALRTASETGIAEFAEAAKRYGVLPELSAALLLVRRYFGLAAWSSDLLDEKDTTVGHILRFAHKSLEEREFLATREDIPVRSVIAFEMGLRRDPAYRRELLLRILFRARMWETIPLPDALFTLYPLLSPIEWVGFRLQRRGKALQEGGPTA